jgi:multiple sugar transport system permease protein
MTLKNNTRAVHSASSTDFVYVKPKKFRFTSDDLWGFAFVSPQVIGFLVFAVFPILLSLYLCFSEWNFLELPKFVGLENFRTVLTDRYQLLWFSVRNTSFFVAGIVPLTMSLSLLLAVLLNRNVPGLVFYKTSYFLPFITASAAVSLLWYWLLAPDLGLINSALDLIGIRGPLWLADPTWARPAVIMYITWQSVGYCYLLFAAGLRNIPIEFYEAAKIDGANSLQQFRFITLPMISPTSFFIMTTMMISGFNLFSEVFILTRGQGGPIYSTYTIVLYIYNLAFRFFTMGQAAVVSWILFLILFVLTMFNFRMSKNWVHYID